MPRTAANWLSLVPMVRKWPTPAARAEASTVSSSGAKSGKARWQWLSTSIAKTGRARPRIQALQYAVLLRACDQARGRNDRLARFHVHFRCAFEKRTHLLPHFHAAVIALTAL